MLKASWLWTLPPGSGAATPDLLYCPLQDIYNRRCRSRAIKINKKSTMLISANRFHSQKRETQEEFPTSWPPQSYRTSELWPITAPDELLINQKWFWSLTGRRPVFHISLPFHLCDGCGHQKYFIIHHYPFIPFANHRIKPAVSVTVHPDIWKLSLFWLVDSYCNSLELGDIWTSVGFLTVFVA